MAWKPKEKLLTAEEAVDLARKELAPLWTGSPPLLAGVVEGSKATAMPLDPAITEKPWLIFFIDLTSFDGQRALIFAKEWQRRYAVHRLGILIVLRPTYAYMSNREFLLAFREQEQLEFVVTLDQDGSIQHAFGAQESMHVLLFFKDQTLTRHQGSNWTNGFELKIQEYLRKSDPGLPLAPPYTPKIETPLDHSRIEFASLPGFVQESAEFYRAKFGPLAPPVEYATHPPLLEISGEWIRDREKIATSDPTATIRINCPVSELSILAQTLSKTVDPSKIAIEVNEKPIYDAIAAGNLVLEDSGVSTLHVRRAGIYHTLTQLPDKERRVLLTFPTANTEPIALYGLRFGLMQS